MTQLRRLCFVVLLLLPRAVEAQQPETMPLPRDALVYSQMSLTSSPLTTLVRGTVVTVLDRQPGWMLVKLVDGKHGYLNVGQVVGTQPQPPQLQPPPPQQQPTGAAPPRETPCTDPLYLELRKKNLNSMTEREWVIFQERDKACLAYQTSQPQAQQPPLQVTSPPRPAVPPPPPPQQAAPPVSPQFQSPPNPGREGLWGTLGIGYGSLGCLDCTERVDGGVGAVGIGGTVSPNVLLFLSSNVWTRTEEGITYTVGAVTAAMRLYPSARGGFFILGGIGAGTVEVETSYLGAESDWTGAAILGIGYDIRVGSMLSLTPFWNGVALAHEEWDLNWGELGIGLTIH